jgi:hypothetical protein
VIEIEKSPSYFEFVEEPMVDDPDGIFKIPLHVFLDRQEEIKKNATRPTKKSYTMFLPNDDEDDSEELLHQLINESLGPLGWAEIVISNLHELKQ